MHLARNRWLIYALGGGLGHLTRAIALARASEHRDVRCSILTNSPWSTHPVVQRELTLAAHDLISIDPRSTPEDVGSHFDRLLLTEQFDAVIVDSFPRGLGGELANRLEHLKLPKILIQRDLSPNYVEWAKLANWVSHYNLAIVPGPEPVWTTHHKQIRVDPFLVRDATSCYPARIARHYLARLAVSHQRSCIGHTAPILLFTGSGTLSEIDDTYKLYRRVTQEYADRVVTIWSSPTQRFRSEDHHTLTPEMLWPVLPFLPGVDLWIASGCGYNTTYEAVSTGTRLVAPTRKRRYDRQQRRARNSSAYRPDQIDQLIETLCDDRTRSASPAAPNHFPNGTHAAVHAIAKLIREFGTSVRTYAVPSFTQSAGDAACYVN